MKNGYGPFLRDIEPCIYMYQKTISLLKVITIIEILSEQKLYINVIDHIVLLRIHHLSCEYTEHVRTLSLIENKK